MPARRDELDEYEDATIERLAKGPASFPKLLEEGVLPDRSTAEVIRSRLLYDHRLVRVGRARVDDRKARTVYALADDGTTD